MAHAKESRSPHGIATGGQAPPLAVLQVGCVSPVGLDAEQTAASLWAGVPRKQSTPFVDRQRQPIVMGHLPEAVLPPLVDALREQRTPLTALQRRLLRLCGPALFEVLETSLAAAPDFAPPLWLAVPESTPDHPEIAGGQFIAQAMKQAEVNLDLAHSRVFPSGHAGLFSAVHHAQREMTAAGIELAVLGGVDSYSDPMRLARLEAEGRLRTRGPQDAFTPGEAAAFLLVATQQLCARHQLEPLAWIDAVGLAQEPGHRYSEQPYRAEGLAAAFSQLFDRPPSPPIELVMAGFNGENMHAKEWGVAYLRSREHFSASLRIEHSAEYIGDAGAALAPVMASIVVRAAHDGRLPGPTLVWGSSDHEARGALLLRAA
ncbi:MAG: hypothetical protein AAF799_00970 [Myxococcota bacterium]